MMSTSSVAFPCVKPHFIVLAAIVAAACAASLTDAEVKLQWENFKTVHDKKYETQAEEMQRMQIFKENLLRINKHNARYQRGEISFKVGVNKYTDMLTHEVVEKMNGFRMELKTPSPVVHKASGEVSKAKKIDWRSKGYVTDVKDQGQCGSCWSFSATGALEGQLFKKNGKLVSLSEQNLIDCSSRYGNAGCDGGLMDAAFRYIKANKGIDTEASYPYLEREGRCRYTSSNSAGANTGFVDVNPTERDLADALEKVGPVSIAIDASNWSFQAYAGGVYYEEECSSTQLDHGVLAVGYGTSNNGGDYWIVKNSWGESWGENGYIKMARNKRNNCGVATMASYPTV